MSTPPQNPTAERAVLGAALMGSRQLEDAAGILQGRDFYFPRHELVWDACLAVANDGRPVDAVAVLAQLGADLERAGGAVYLSELTSADVSPNPGQLVHYAHQVLDAALRRRLITAGHQVTQYAEQAGDPTEAAQLSLRAVEEASSQARTAEGGTSVGDSIESTMDWLQHKPVGADTPWVDVNFQTNGLLAGQMVTVAARPGHGKSLVAKDVAVFTAKQGRPVHIATLEMSRHDYMARILAGEAKVDLGKMLRRQMSDQEWDAVAAATERVRELPLYLDDRERQSMAQIRAAAKQTVKRYGKPLGLLAIDYCQLVTPTDPRMVREQQVAAISRETKIMAKEFGCPAMLLAQLNRKAADRSSHTPLITDLRESGSLEQDSDQVWLLHRPDQYDPEANLGELQLIVAKNRNGPAPLTVPLSFQGHYARVTSWV